MIKKFLKKVHKILKSKEIKKLIIIKNYFQLLMKLILIYQISIFDKRIQGIKALNDYIDENIKNQNLMKMVIYLIQKNEIIKSNNIKSNKILSLLLKNNEIKEDDIKLI